MEDSKPNGIKLSNFDLKGELIERSWIDNFIDQGKFFNDNSAYYQVQVLVLRYCGCCRKWEVAA